MPFLSNLTGDWITPTQASDPTYWARQLREAVRFGDCLATLLSDDDWLLVECGPGRQLCGLVRLQHPTGDTKALPSLPQRDSRETDLATMSETAGTLWAAGVELNAESFGAPGYRIPLPTYPWERKRYWVEPGRRHRGSVGTVSSWPIGAATVGAMVRDARLAAAAAGSPGCVPACFSAAWCSPMPRPTRWSPRWPIRAPR